MDLAGVFVTAYRSREIEGKELIGSMRRPSAATARALVGCIGARELPGRGSGGYPRLSAVRSAISGGIQRAENDADSTTGPRMVLKPLEPRTGQR